MRPATSRVYWAKVSMWVALGVLGLTGVVFWANVYWRQENEPDYSRAAAIDTGMSEAQVRARLGEPWRTYERATAPADYYVRGYSHPNRSISSKVLIYFGGSDMIVYVYLGKDGRVEGTFVGGS